MSQAPSQTPPFSFRRETRADVIAPTLAVAAAQRARVWIILVDDRSMDDTVSNARLCTYSPGIALLPNPLLLGARPSLCRGPFHGYDMDLS